MPYSKGKPLCHVGLLIAGFPSCSKMITVKMAAKNAKMDLYFINNCYCALKLIQPVMKTAQTQEEGDVWKFFVGRPDGAWQ